MELYRLFLGDNFIAPPCSFFLIDSLTKILDKSTLYLWCKEYPRGNLYTKSIPDAAIGKWFGRLGYLKLASPVTKEKEHCKSHLLR